MDELFRNLAHLMNHRKQAGEEGFVELMGKILSDWPDAGWELGPDLIDSGIDRLSLSIDDAPELVARLPLQGDGWIIDFGIPPRDWDIYFEAGMNGKDFAVEGSEWFFTMEASADDVMLTLAPSPQCPGLADDELEEFANIIVTGELGEANVANYVRWIDVSPTSNTSEEWFPMESLRKKFAATFPHCAYGSWLATSR